MTNKQKGNILYYTGLAAAIAAPLITACIQMPIIKKTADTSEISALFIICAFICAAPLYKHINITFKSPTNAVVWTVVFAMCWALDKIIHQVLLVAFVGMVANIICAFLCGIGNYLRKPKNEEKTG